MSDLTRMVPTKEDVIAAAWALATSDISDAVKLATLPTDEWGGLNLIGLTELRRGANGVVEIKMVDRGRLLERLLDVVDSESSERRYEELLQALQCGGEDDDH